MLAMSRTSSKSHLFKELSGAMERVPGWYCAPRLNVGNRIVINIHPTGFNYSATTLRPARLNDGGWGEDGNYSETLNIILLSRSAHL